MASFFYNHRYLVRRPKERKRQYKLITDERTGKWGRVEIVPKPKPEYIQRMRRLIPAASDLGHDPKYGGWIDPFKGRWGQGKEKKKKTYEYY